MWFSSQTSSTRWTWVATQLLEFHTLLCHSWLSHRVPQFHSWHAHYMFFRSTKSAELLLTFTIPLHQHSKQASRLFSAWNPTTAHWSLPFPLSRLMERGGAERDWSPLAFPCLPYVIKNDQSAKTESACSKSSLFLIKDKSKILIWSIYKREM